MSTGKPPFSLEPHSHSAATGVQRAPTPEPRPSGRERGLQARWNAYLATLAQPRGPLTAEHAESVKRFWRHLRSLRSWNLPVPQAGPTEAPGFLLVWDRGRHHLEIEIYDDGTFDWFYRDRRDESYFGDDGLAPDARPSDLMDRIHLFCNGSP